MRAAGFPYSMISAWLVLFVALPVLADGQSCPTRYPVRAGDYLCNITNYHHISSDAILSANPGALMNNSRDNLLSGNTLILPCPQKACCPVWQYAARANDSYYSISQKFNLSLNTILAANNISKADTTNTTDSDYSDDDSYDIQCGDTIYIPCSPGQPQCGAPAPSPLPQPLSVIAEAPLSSFLAPAARPPPPTPSTTSTPLPATNPPSRPTPTPFRPLKFQFWIPTMIADRTSTSWPWQDSIYVNTFCRVDGLDSSSSPNGSPEIDMHTGQTRHRWNGCQAVVTNPNSTIQMGFSMVNVGNMRYLSTIVSSVTDLTVKALDATGKSVWDPVVQAAGQTLRRTLFPNCDGLVAADGFAFAVSNFTSFNQFQNGRFSRSYPSRHCSEDSKYRVEFLVVILGPA